MRYRFHPIVCFVLAVLPAGLPCASLAQPPREKTIWNYDGGVFLLTEGGIHNGPCFYIRGRMTAPKFFDGLKRIDDDNGLRFRRGTETVTHFPDKLLLSFVIYDVPCSDKLQLQQTSTHTYLTRSLINSLRINMYWKRGIELRPITNVVPLRFTVEPVAPYATALAHELPEKFEWLYEFSVPAAGVPLTDGLALVFRNADGHIVARVAARL